MITETSDDHVYACGKDGKLLSVVFNRNAGSLEPAVNLFESWIYFFFFLSLALGKMDILRWNIRQQRAIKRA